MVTAFLYAGLPGKHHWMTALQAVHFLATAFAAGPALLIVISMIIRKVSRFDPGSKAMRKLAEISLYALLLHIFFIGLEFFTAFYSQSPGHMHALEYLYVGLDGHRGMLPIVWTSSGLALLGLVLLAVPAARKNDRTLTVGCLAVFVSIWLDKGFAFVASGFIPNSFDRITEYQPDWNELLVAAGVWAVGVMVFTLLCKMAIAVKEEAILDQHGERQVR
jgi:Ni/Fe-hydrogenase subunit HybB-like protein